mgnify:CR=1 FL=1
MLKFPEHKASLSLTHNQHKAYYEPIADYIMRIDEHEWVSLEERDRALAADEIWELQWYPETPVGSYLLCGSTLEAVMERFQ